MAAKVELMIQVCVNGRPIWRKAKTMKPEMSRLLTDREYDRVIDAAIRELAAEQKVVKEREAKAETAGKK